MVRAGEGRVGEGFGEVVGSVLVFACLDDVVHGSQVTEDAPEEVRVKRDGLGKTGGSFGRAVVLGHFVEEVGFNANSDGVEVGGLYVRLVLILARLGRV